MLKFLFLLSIAAFIVLLTVMAVMWSDMWSERSPKPTEQKGTWHRCQETYPSGRSSVVRILLIREHKGVETGRLLIAEVDSNDKDWNNKYTEALAEADNRLAVLAIGEHE